MLKPSVRAQTARRRWPVLLYVVIAAIALTTRTLPTEQAAPAAVVGMVLGLGTAARLFYVNSRDLERSERRAWTLVGLGIATVAFALVVHSAAMLVQPDVPTFGPLDFFWLAGYAIGIVGLGFLPHMAGSIWQRARLLLDGIIGAVAAGTLLWAGAMRDLTVRLGDSPTWERLVGSAYIVLDVAIIFVLFIVVVRRSMFRFDRRIVFFAMALSVQGIADYAFLTSGIGRSFNDAEPLFAMHLLAAALLLAAANNVDRAPEPREYAERLTTPIWALVVPYGLAGTLGVVVLAGLSERGASATDQGLMFALVTIVILVIARQGVAIREGKRLLDEQRSHLASSISHELRTPLTSIVGFLDLLDGDGIADPDERRQMISLVSHQAADLSRIVADLVLVASDVDRPVELEIGALPVADLVHSAVEATSLDPSLVSVELDTRMVAFVDQARMRQAVSSLLNNAARYGGRNIEALAQAKGGDLVIEVHDDGPGVPRKYELRIWEKFERGPNRLNAAVPGAGVGLAIASAIVAAHGGSAGYRRSERLGGACFWIRLPGRVHIEPSPAAGPALERPTATQSV